MKCETCGHTMTIRETMTGLEYWACVNQDCPAMGAHDWVGSKLEMGTDYLYGRTV